MTRVLLILTFIAALLLPSSLAISQDDSPQFEMATVTRIVDGDTIEVRFEDGFVDVVRYIGIDAPELDAPCGAEATQINFALMGRTVALVRDVRNMDEYGRLLRYVYVDGLFVNAALVSEGWALAAEYPPDTTFAEWFDLLETQAKEAKVGCYAIIAAQFETVAPTNTPAPVNTPAPTGVTVSTTGNVNLRTGPGTNYPVAGTLSANSSRRATGRNGDWLYLGSNQWIASWVVTVTGNINSLPVQTAPAPPAAQPAAPAAPAAPVAAPAFTCDCSKTCGAMASCQEAYFQLNQCGCGRRDGDNDGVPCEDICPGG